MASPRNRRVAEAITLQTGRGRRLAGRALLEGPNLLVEAMAAAIPVETLFCLPGDPLAEEASAAGAEVVVVTERVLKRLSTTEHPQSPVAVISIPDAAPSPAASLLVAWGVTDPGNLGTIIRTAAAFGLGFFVGPQTTDPWSPKVLRAAAGGHFRCGVGVAQRLEELRGTGRKLLATVSRGGISPDSIPPLGPHAVLVGEEAAGLPEEVVAACDLQVTVPMPGGTESLNAAIAGAIVAYEVAVRLGGGRPGGD